MSVPCQQLNNHALSGGEANPKSNYCMSGPAPITVVRMLGFSSRQSHVQGMLDGKQQLSLALEYGDLLRASMAGNLRTFEFENAQGQVQKQNVEFSSVMVKKQSKFETRALMLLELAADVSSLRVHGAC